MKKNYILSVFLLLLLAFTQAIAQRVGDPGVTFDASKFDPNYPEMLEWQKAGVEGGIPFRSESPVVKTISVTNSAGISEAMEYVHNQGGGQLVLNNGTYTIDATIRMLDNVRIVGESKDGVILNVIMTGPNNQQRQAIIFGVENAGIENLTIQGGFGTPQPYSMTNARPDFMTNSISFNSNSKNCWLDNVNILNSGHHAITSWNSSHITIRDCYIDGSWNKGGGGRGYVQISGNYTLMHNTVVKKLRHIVIQGQHSKYNVFYKNEVEQDFNFHNADAGFNLIEQNISRLPAGLAPGWHSMMGPWSVQHSVPGPRNAIYRNDCIEYNNGGAVTFSDPNLVYIPARFENNNPFDTSTETPIGGTFYPVNNVVEEVIEATDVTVTPERRTLSIGETLPLHVRVMPYFTTNKSVTFSSSNEEVATVDERGFVKAVGTGTANITVTTEDGGFQATTRIFLEGEIKYAETFELIDLSSDQSLSDYNYTGDSGYDWTVNGQFMAENEIDGSKGISADSGTFLESGTITDGISSFSVECMNIGDDGTPRTIRLLVNGNEVGSQTSSSIDELYTFTVNGINITGDVILSLEIDGGTIAIDNVSWAPFYSYHETFDNMTLDGWGSETFMGNHGFSWRVMARGENERLNDGKNVFFKNNTVGIKSGTISGGISSFSVDCLDLFANVGGERIIELIINGDVIETFTHSGPEKYRFKVDNIDIEGDFILEIRNASGGGLNTDNSIAFDNIKWDPYNLTETTDFNYTETLSKTSDPSDQFITETLKGDYGIAWTIRSARVVTGDFGPGKNIYFYGGVTGLESGVIPGGISALTLDIKNKFWVNNERVLEVLVNGNVVGKMTHTGSDAHTFTVDNLNIEGDFTLAIRNASTIGDDKDAIAIGNISWNSYTGAPTTRFTTESFEQFNGSGFTNATHTLDNGNSWNLQGTINIGDFNQWLRSFVFRSDRTGLESTNPIPGGIGSFSMEVMNLADPGNQRRIELIINDQVVETITHTGTGRYIFAVDDINIAGEFTLAIRNASNANAQNRINVNNITWTNYSGDTEVTNAIWTGTMDNKFTNSFNWRNNRAPSVNFPAYINDTTEHIPLINFEKIVELSDMEIGSKGALEVHGILNIKQQLANDGTIIFKSDSLGTGQLEKFTGTMIGDGQFTVEQFISTGDNGNNKINLLSSPMNTSGSIRDNWQEGVNNTGTNFPMDNLNPNPGYGMHITGSTTGDFGFDATISGTPSLFTYDNTYIPSESDTSVIVWKNLSNTDNETFKAGQVFSALIYGDRSVNLADSDLIPTTTTLRMTGELHTGDYSPALSNLPGFYNLLGNPYQAMVDLTKLEVSGDINMNHIYVWNPDLGTDGAYETIDDLSPQILKPGQNVFVRNAMTVYASPTVVFTEEAKKTAGAADFDVEENDLESLSLSLYSPADVKLDQLTLRLEKQGNNEIDNFDAGKLVNPNENIAIVNDEELLSIERRNIPKHKDRIPLFVDNYQFEQYTFKVNLENWNDKIKIELNDRFSNTNTLLKQGEAYSFNVNPNNRRSIATDRFTINLTNTEQYENRGKERVTLYPNPSRNGNFFIKTKNEQGAVVTVRIHNVFGEEKYSQDHIVNEKGEVTVNTSGLSFGNYSVILLQNDEVHTMRLMVK